jgi:ACDE family multidrug resistance protein
VSNKVLSNKNLPIIFGITLLAVMGVSSLTPAFPKIIKRFDINPHQVGLLITVFTFPGIILTPILGILADRLGRKRILVPSIFLFGLAGGACGFTRDFELLLAFRVLQGIGAASLGSLNVTLIGDIFSGRDRITAMGYNASVLSTGTASYPAIGGGLAMIGWNFPFFLPLLGIPLGLWVLFSLDNPEPSSGLGLGTYLKKAFESVWKLEVLGLFLLNICTFIMLYGAVLTYFPIKLEATFRSESYVIGLILSVSSISSAITASQLGKISGRFSARQILVVAIFLYACSLLLVPLVSSQWMMVLPSMLFGTAGGMNLPTLQTLLVGSAPSEYRAAFMAVNGMVLRLGQTLGPLIIGAVYAIKGIDAVFIAGAGVTVIMALIILLIIRGTGSRH